MSVVHSKFSNGAILALAGTCFAVSIAIVYILKKSEKLNLFEEKASVHSFGFTIIEVPVPVDVVGVVIGRRGKNIDQIEKTTSTKIKFKDEDGSSQTRSAFIRGKSENAHEAEKLLRTLIVEKMNVLVEDVFIPMASVGSVIGKNGNNIRQICDRSNTNVTVESTPSNEELQKVSIRGSSKDISLAKLMIERHVWLASERDKDKVVNPADLEQTFNGRKMLYDVSVATERKSAPSVEDLIPTGQDGYLEVFVSFVESPSRFWVQPIGINYSTKLDKLTNNMTAYYEDCRDAKKDEKEDLFMEIKEGDIVATTFSYDSQWYRARVISVEMDDYAPGESDVTLFYADYGDTCVRKLKDVKPMEPTYLSLPFQAVECKLAKIEPVIESWGKDAIVFFDTISNCCQWKATMLKVLDEGDEDGSQVKSVVLVDTNATSDTNIAEALVRKRFATLVKPKNPAQPITM